MPPTEFVLHDIEGQKECVVLYHHSEKLDVTFGLISVSPRTPICIVKNLQVCGDCHYACKFNPKIVAKEIIVRDDIQ